MDLVKLSDRVAKQLLTLEADYEKEIALSLRDALNQMRGEMARIYEKYATAGKLTKAEMTRYNRYATMEKQMLAALDPALKANLRTIRRLTPEQYEASFFRYAWSIDQSTGLRLAWGNVNKAEIAAALASEYSKISLERYTLDARMAIRSALNNGLSLGKSYAQMASDLKKAINTTNFKASRIVRTEGQYAVNAGQDAAYQKAKENGVIGNERWQATLDPRTREDHRDMDGKGKEEDGLYHLPNGDTAPYPVWEGLSAENRINCIPEYEIPIGIDTEKIYKRWYEGDLVRIKSANGLQFDVTVNHPILTDKGWIAAHLIDKSSNIVCMSLTKKLNRRYKDVNYSPPVISKIFNLLRIVSIKKRDTGMDSQFHGDGRDGNIDIEFINSKLWNSFEAAFYKPLIEFSLSLPYILTVYLFRLCKFFCRFVGFLFSPNSIVRGLRKFKSILWGSLGHSKIHRSGSSSRTNTIIEKDKPYTLPTHSDIFSKSFLGSSGQVFIDNVISIERVPYSGHVYNLQTKSGYYGLYHDSGNIAIVHNCRCHEILVIDGYEPQLRRTREQGVIPYQNYREWEAGLNARGKSVKE